MKTYDSMDDVQGDAICNSKKTTVYKLVVPTLGDDEKQNYIEGSSAKKKISPLLRQIWVALAPIFATFTAGLTVGLSATMLPQLELEDSIIKVTKSDLSWIASFAVLPMAPGCLLGGFLMEKYGRKKCLILHCIPAIIGWIAVIFSTDLPLLLIGRFLTGISAGWLGPPSSILIGETSEPAYRGFLLAGITLAISLGVLVVHVIGTFLTWRNTAIVCGVFPILSYLLISTIPETPSWLMRQNRHQEAEESFRWLRGHSSEVTSEFENMLKKHDIDRISEDGKKTGLKKLKSNMKKAEFWKPLGIILGFFFVMQYSGVNVVTFYTVTIMKDILGNNSNEYLSMILIDLVRVVMSIVACVLTRTMYRKTLTIFSGLGTGVCMLALSVFMHFTKKEPEVFKNFTWVPLIFLIGYVSFFTCGLFALPWILNGELFSLATKSVGSGITSAFNFFIFFIVVQTAPTMFSVLAVEGTFLCYGIIVLIGSIILYTFMIETKNKTLQEIEDEFRK